MISGFITLTFFPYFYLCYFVMQPRSCLPLLDILIFWNQYFLLEIALFCSLRFFLWVNKFCFNRFILHSNQCSIKLTLLLLTLVLNVIPGPFTIVLFVHMRFSIVECEFCSAFGDRGLSAFACGQKIRLIN